MQDILPGGRGLTLLHQAVIAGNLSAVKRLLDKKADINALDPFGFTPIELAKLLGRSGCLELLVKEPVRSYKVQQQDSSLGLMTQSQFEKVFKITYRPYLTFGSYRGLAAVIDNCPHLLRSKWFASDNYGWGEQYGEKIATGALADVSIRWINEKIGYGVFTEKEIPKGAFIGEYTGRVRRLYRQDPDPNAYCLAYPTKWWSFNYFAIDALSEGNLMRFVNHDDSPNLQPFCAIDRGLLHHIFIADQFIAKGDQLTCHYGPDYWGHRKKVSFVMNSNEDGKEKKP